MLSWNALRALARVELRQLRRNPGRSLLVVLLIAVPVAAMVGGSALLFMVKATLEEQRAQAMGQATLRLEGGPEVPLEEALAELGPDARHELASRGQAEVGIPGRRLRTRAYALAETALAPGGVAVGMLRLVDGRSPARPGEVALSRILLESLDLGPGDEVLLDERSHVVTGEVAAPENLGLPLTVRWLGPEPVYSDVALLVELPDERAEALAAAWKSRGATVSLRSETGSSDNFEAFLIVVCGSFGFFEAALVIAAAFGVSMRRRQREIGLLGSNGATRGGIVASLLASAAVQAVLGGLLGLLVGATAAWFVHPHLDDWTGRMVGPFELSGVHVAAALALGIVTAILAAVIPARAAAALPVRVALSGRRPVAGSTNRWLGVGVVLAALGTALVFLGALDTAGLAGLWILAGSILLALGLGSSSPWILDRLAALAGPLPVAWRLAVRDAGRFRARNGPVVTAVMAGMSISVLLAALLASVQNLQGVFEPGLRDDSIRIDGPAAEEVARAMLEELDGVAAAPLLAAYAEGELVRARFPGATRDGESEPFEAWIAVADAGGAGLTEVLASPGARTALAAGELVALVEDSPGELADLRGAGNRELGTPAVTHVSTTQRIRQPKVLLGSAGMAELGFEAGLPPFSRVRPWVVRLAEPITVETAERARVLAAGYPGSSIDAEILRSRHVDRFYSVVFWICIVTGLVVIFVATTLSSVESAVDARILHTVGASPGLLRGHVAARSGYLALLGCGLAVPAGLMPMLGFQRMSAVSLELILPWNELAITVFAMPLVAYFGTWAAAALRLGTRSHVPQPRFTP